MKTALLILLSLSFQYAYSQTQIRGSVKTVKQNILIGASVMIKGTYDGAITNVNGDFNFKTNKRDSIQLIVKYIGFETRIIPLIISGNTLNIDVLLKEKFNELNVVTITAGAFEAGDKKNAVLLSSLDMITTPGASGNVSNALQFLPGTSTNGESGKLFVRGGESSESQTFIDGTLVHNPYNSSAPNTSVRSRFNPFMFSGTIFSTGGFSAEYGQALSSVLLLETKGIQEKDQLDISILSVGLGLAGTKKWKKSAITASIDYTDLTPYIKLFPQTIDWVKKPNSIESAINYRLKTKKGLFKIYGNYSQSKFSLFSYNLDSKTDDLLNLKNENTYLNSSYKGLIGEKWIINMSGAFTDYKETTDFNKNKFSKQIYGAHLKTKLKRSFTKRVKLNTGLEVFSEQYNQTYTTKLDTIPFNFTNHILASFVESELYISEKLVTRIGARLDHATHLNQTVLAPRLSTAYKLNKTSQIALAYGLFYQAPSQDYLIYTNKLKFEHTQQYMLNYTYSKSSRSIKGEVYFKNYKNLVKFDESNQFYQPNYYTNKGNGYAYGFDFYFRDKKTIKNGDYWVSYSYLDTKRNYLNYPETASPRFASKHNLSIVYKHWVKKCRTLFGASFNYSSPRFYNDPNQNNFNNQKMKAYQSLNLNASFLYREHIIFYASATNVLGYKQEYGYKYSNTPNTEGVYEKSLITPPSDRFFILGLFITLSKSGDQNQLDKLN